MHMCWLRHIGGRLTSRYRYSIGLVYNTFPLPHVGAKSKPTIEALAKDILNARKAHPGSSLSGLYNPATMPANLQRAHRALDQAVEKLYRSKKFTSEMERLEHLMAEYEKLVSASQT